MVDSLGRRRTTSRSTVRPPTPESKKPMDRGSLMTRSRLGRRRLLAFHGLACRLVGARAMLLLHGAYERLGNRFDVAAHARLGTEQCEWLAAVVRLQHHDAVTDHLEVRMATEHLGHLVARQAALGVGAVRQVAHP